ncbi:hypothetical protein [Paenibacillus dendritiformis]|uniref:hypothetical protein n=1 Tax=Paenibacillus dendritiformis TaxID=130049 RepID=UPI00140AC218|nr:hypothetical protein [Paenibacillus dendritiformis]
MKEVTFFIEDVFPLIYLKLIVEGPEPMQLVKHLLVDEFPAKNNPGDATQSVNAIFAC